MRVRVIASRLYVVQILERFVVVRFVLLLLLLLLLFLVLFCFVFFVFFLWAEVIYSFHYLPTLSFLDFFQILERFVFVCFVLFCFFNGIK